MNKNSIILITGSSGMLGKALVTKLLAMGFKNLLLTTSKTLDLSSQEQVKEYFSKNKIDYIFHVAAKVGGIAANKKYPADFLFENLAMQSNVIHEAHKHKIKKLLFIGSSCIYPRNCPQPMREEYLLTGTLEPTNESYALAKIVGIKLCEAYKKQYGDNFISAMPTNLYGPGDNYHKENSHVIPAMIRRFHEAKEDNAPSVTIWGTGAPMREFLYVNDLAEACIKLMDTYNENTHINIGTGEDVTIKELAETIKEVTGYTGDIVFDTEKPDGTPRKLLDVSKIHDLGWKHAVNLKTGIQLTYNAFLEELSSGKLRGL